MTDDYEAPEIAGTGHIGDEGIWLHAYPAGIVATAVCEGGVPIIGDGLLAYWSDVLKHTPIAALVDALKDREGVETTDLGDDWHEINIVRDTVTIFVDKEEL